MSEALANPYQEIFRSFDAISDVLIEMGRIRSKPIIGGEYGSGRFALASVPYVRSGLDAVMYFVLDLESMSAIAAGNDQSSALQLGRNMLRKCDRLELAMYFGRRKVEIQRREAEQRRAIEEAQREVDAINRRQRQKVSSIPRRRQRIFEESEGKCHYCGDALTLDGKWHIEHKMPKALGGGNDPGNLVASCVPCNMKKRDTTDQEFKARRAREAA